MTTMMNNNHIPELKMNTNYPRPLLILPAERNLERRQESHVGKLGKLESLNAARGTVGCGHLQHYVWQLPCEWVTDLCLSHQLVLNKSSLLLRTRHALSHFWQEQKPEA